MATTSRTTTVLAGLDGVRSWQDFYRDLQRNPELSHQEHRTAAAVAQRLRSSVTTRTRASAAPG